MNINKLAIIFFIPIFTLSCAPGLTTKSEPPGAVLTLDGVIAGDTPVEVNKWDLPAKNEHHFVLVKEGNKVLIDYNKLKYSDYYQWIFRAPENFFLFLILDIFTLGTATFYPLLLPTPDEIDFFLSTGEGQEEIFPLAEVTTYYDKSDLSQPLFRKVTYKLRDNDKKAVRLIDNKRVGFGMRFGKFVPYREHVKNAKKNSVPFYAFDLSFNTHDYFRIDTTWGLIDNSSLSYNYSDNEGNIYNLRADLKGYYLQMGPTFAYPFLHFFELSLSSGINYHHTERDEKLSRYYGSQLEEIGTLSSTEERMTIYTGVALGLSPNPIPLKITIGVKTNDIFQFLRYYNSGSEWSAGFQFLF